MLSETKAELDEFHSASKELEAELEAELARTEKAQQDLKVKVSKAESERDEWKVRRVPQCPACQPANILAQSKFMSLQTAHNTTTASLQRELDKVRQEYQQIKVQLRELEMGNDDLERNERAVSSSLADMEAKYSRVLEEKILLEQELLEKVNIEEGSQRLKDELRGMCCAFSSRFCPQPTTTDANEEIAMLRNKLADVQAIADKAVADLQHEQSIRMPPPPTPEGIKKAASPDLDLSDLSPAPTSPSPSQSTPRSSGLTRSTTTSFQRSGIYRESPVSGVRAAGFTRSVTTGSFSPGTFSPASSANTRLPPARQAPGRIVQTNSYASTSSTSTTSKNKGVQMVSEMRARVRNLEQKIHTRVPRLRMTGLARNSVSSTTSHAPSSSVSSASNASTAKTSWESQRPSPVSRKSSEALEGFDTPGKGDSSGWVLIMEDSPSPVKDKERRAQRRLSNPTAPTAFRSTSASSPSQSTGPASSYLGMSSNTIRRPPSRLSSGGNKSPGSRPISPTFIPQPALRRSIGPSAPNNPYASSSRTPLSSSSRGTETRTRSTTVPAPIPALDPTKMHDTGKALPRLPTTATNPSNTGSLRQSRSSSTANAVSSILSKSRIGRPSTGRKSGNDTNLDINDLRPRSEASSSSSNSFFGN